MTLAPGPTRPNLGLGHTADCPHFETCFPWKCDCQVRALRAATASSKAWSVLDDVAQLAHTDGEGAHG